jgi:hypothetical protein
MDDLNIARSFSFTILSIFLSAHLTSPQLSTRAPRNCKMNETLAEHISKKLPLRQGKGNDIMGTSSKRNCHLFGRQIYIKIN